MSDYQILVDQDDMELIAQALENAHSYSLAHDLTMQYKNLQAEVTATQLNEGS